MAIPFAHGLPFTSHPLGPHATTAAQLTLSIALGVGLTACSQPRPPDAALPARAGRQCYAAWTPPETLVTSGGMPAHVDQLVTPVRLGPSLLLFGAGAYVWREGEMPRDERERDAGELLGVSIGADRRIAEVRKPSGMRRLSAVWALPASEGGVHVVWGAPADSARGPFTDAATVWYSHYDGTRWTPAELVMSAATINWRWKASVTAVGDDIVVAAPASEGAWRGIITARRTRGRWGTPMRLPGAGRFAPNSTVLVAADSEVLLFYPGLGAANAIGTAALYTRRLARNADAWTDATLIHELPGGPYWPELDGVRTPDGVVHLFWNYRATGSDRDVLSHSSSRDLVEWGPPDQLPLDANALDYTVAPYGRSDVLAVVRTGARNTPLIALWGGGRPQLANAATIPVEAATPPTLTVLGRDTLLLTSATIWLKPEADRTSSLGLVTVVSRTAGSCR